MMQRKPRRKSARGTLWELSLIFMLSALLTASATGLAARALSASALPSDPYPGLHAPARTGAAEPPAEKTVYFTFDDGPSKNTAEILDVLLAYDAKATFFITPQYEDREFVAAMLERMVAEGHTIGLHSHSHNFSQIYRNADAYLEDLDRLNTFIVDSTGFRPQIVRFPGGSRTVNASRDTMAEIIAAVTQRGYLFYDWHVVSGDDTATVYPAETLADNMLKGIRGQDQSVVLCHDNATPKTTAQAVRLVMEALRDEGYAFRRLTPDVPPVHTK